MIRIQNIYYMLAYAFQVLNEQGFASCAAESFDNAADLLSEILIRGIAGQIKKGLHREYQNKKDALSCLRGKINISETIKQQASMRHQLVCNFDEFNEDSYFNRILKTTIFLLLRADIAAIRKRQLKKLLPYFENVKVIRVQGIKWKLSYNRFSQTYQMLISICWLVIKGLLQTQADGSVKLMDYLDEQRMCRLYEKFVLEYYRKEYPQLCPRAAYIDWALKEGEDPEWLPQMKSDILLSGRDKELIIDTKYYAHTMQLHYGVQSIHSHNLYQIFTYVKNRAAGEKEVAGMLLYARTDEAVQPDKIYSMSGNTISVRTLNLNCDFSQIKQQLNEIATQVL